jgi:hypothetical protein
VEVAGLAVAGIVRGLAAMLVSIKELEKAVDEHFGQHPDAQILRSLPGLGVVLGARVLGEFGDDSTRFVDAASRRAYAGSAPITRASGKARAMLVRHAQPPTLRCVPANRVPYDEQAAWSQHPPAETTA